MVVILGSSGCEVSVRHTGDPGFWKSPCPEGAGVGVGLPVVGSRLQQWSGLPVFQVTLGVEVHGLEGFQGFRIGVFPHAAVRGFQ